MVVKMRRRGVATVRIVVQAPRDQQSGTWRWETLPDHSPAGDEPVYSEKDLLRVMLGYGSIVAQLLRRQGPSTFRLLACGLMTGRTIGSYQWTWHARLGQFEPTGDPWVIWDEQSDRVVMDIWAGQQTTQTIKIPQQH